MLKRQWILILFLLAIIGCADDPMAPEPIPIEPLPPSPASPLRDICALFNDRLRSAAERTRIYRSLFSPGIAFICPDSVVIDCAFPFQPEQASEIFDELAAGVLSEANVRITNDPPHPLDPPVKGRETWWEIPVTDIKVRLSTNIGDGLELIGGRARVLVAPQADDGWVITEWRVQGPSPSRIRQAYTHEGLQH